MVTRPDSRDAPHLFGLGLVEMLGDEITHDLRRIRAQAVAAAKRTQRTACACRCTARASAMATSPRTRTAAVDTSEVRGVDADLRVRPFFAQGGTLSIREFIDGALKAEMGLEAADPDLCAAH